MKTKELHIKTIDDVLEHVNKDNIDNFLTDFSQFLIMHTEIKEMLPEGVKIGAEFIWIDDGETGCKEVKIKFGK